ncbi:MAG: hypothetical protein ACXQTS_07625, partial [Candidatus Methanospirareceae archaeon]
LKVHYKIQFQPKESRKNYIENLAGAMFKIVMIAMFFSVDITYVVSKLLKREELRRFAKLVEIPEAKDIYRFLSGFSEKQFIGLVLGVLRSICVKRLLHRLQTLLSHRASFFEACCFSTSSRIAQRC